MSHSYKKIQYEEEIGWGATQTRTLYCWSNNTVDVVTVYDDTGNEILCYSECGYGGKLDMGQAIVKLLTGEYEELQSMTKEEIESIVRRNPLNSK